MPDSIYNLSDIAVFLVLTLVTITFSIIAIIITKRFFSHKLRYKDNATISSISALIGIIYGVLVGFIALYLINNHDHASDAVQREANAAADIYRINQWVTQPSQAQIVKTLQDYLHVVIDKEWPLMQEFKNADQGGDTYIKNMSDDLKAFVPATNSQAVTLSNLITQISALYDARHERLAISRSQLSPELWEVVLIGTILIIVINYVFRVNFALHVFAVSVFAIMAASMLFLLVTLDRPFQGEFVVSPDPLREVLNSTQAS